MVALGHLCFSCFAGASGAVASMPFVYCPFLACVVESGIMLPFPAFERWKVKVEVCLSLLSTRLGGWGGKFAGDAGGVSAAGDAGGVSAAGDAGGVSAAGAGAFVLILTLMQSYMGRPSS